LLRQAKQNLAFFGSGGSKLLALTPERRLLRCSQPLPGSEERSNVVGVAARELVHGPQHDRRLTELLDARCGLDLARLLQPLRKVVAGTGEVRRQRGVQAVELGFELGHDGERLGHRRVVAILEELGEGGVAGARLDHAGLGRADRKWTRRPQIEVLVRERSEGTAYEGAGVPDPRVAPVA
jgi:hypothetical protein